MVKSLHKTTDPVISPQIGKLMQLSPTFYSRVKTELQWPSCSGCSDEVC